MPSASQAALNTRSGAEFGAAFGATGTNYGTPAWGGHSCTESVGALTLQHAGLVSSLHLMPASLLVNGKGGKVTAFASPCQP